ncbi:hypothetical protein BDN70DRAFT_702580 [Pholiota conissans]|uniref:Uncharacterized protein n=1 Tax=Pholiota conissans TaxID=109636 RepID=A0A9P5Z0I0_9AGAR|nr:hypothetical protein BDN70DRAFT_702580 [Pholiota conissans]
MGACHASWGAPRSPTCDGQNKVFSLGRPALLSNRSSMGSFLGRVASFLPSCASSRSVSRRRRRGKRAWRLKFASGPWSCRIPASIANAARCCCMLSDPVSAPVAALLQASWLLLATRLPEFPPRIPGVSSHQGFSEIRAGKKRQTNRKRSRQRLCTYLHTFRIFDSSLQARYYLILIAPTHPRRRSHRDIIYIICI